MNKRLIALLCTLAIAVSVFAVVLVPKANADADTYQVGWARVDINPYTPHQLAEGETAVGSTKVTQVSYTEMSGGKYVWNSDLERYVYTSSGGTHTRTESVVEGYAYKWKDSSGNLHYGDIMQLPLRGSGDTIHRQSTTNLIDDNGDGKISVYDENKSDYGDGLFASCLAVTGANDETVLLMSVAIIGGFDSMVEDARAGIVKALKAQGITIAPENIQIQGTHTHNSIDLAQFKSSYNAGSSATTYYLTDANGDRDDTLTPIAGQTVYDNFSVWYPYLVDQLVSAGVEAVKDQSAATMYKGQVEANETAAQVVDGWDSENNKMNGVRHYSQLKGGSWFSDSELYITGPNFNSAAAMSPSKSGDGTIKVNSNGAAEMAEANDTMLALGFQFADGSKDPIALINWRAHTTQNNRDGTVLNVSSCYVNRMSYELQVNKYRAIFIQGAAGNINPSSSVYGGWCDSSKHKDDGDGIWLGNELTGNIYGEALGKVAVACMTQTMENRVSTGDVKVTNIVFNPDAKSYTNEIEYWAGRTIDETRSTVSITYPFVYPLDMTQAIYNAASEEARAYYNTLSGSSSWKKLYQESYYTNYSGATYAVASKFHAADAKNNYLSTGTEDVALTAFMLGDDVAFVTAPGELYDRYNSSITWEQLKATGSQQGIYDALNSYNKWDILLSSVNGGSYGTPFVMGYANRHIGYLPNYIAYEYSKDSTKAAVGSYEAHCTELEQGEGEAIIDVYAQMLKQLATGSSTLYTKGTCSVCGAEVYWKTVSARYNNGSELFDGHFRVTQDLSVPQIATVSYGHSCYDLNGHTLTSATRFLNMANGKNSTLTIQDTAGTGNIYAAGTTSPTTGWGGGVLFVGGNNTLNIYGGTFNQVIDGEHYVRDGGVLFTRGTVNMYGGTLKAGTAWRYGATAYVYKDTNGVGWFNIYGGTIENGAEQIRPNNTNSFVGTCVYNASGAYTTLSGNPTVADIYVENTNGLSVSGGFGGSAQLTYKTAPSAGATVGVSNNAVINTTNLTIANTDYIVKASGSNLVAGTADTCGCCSKGSVVVTELNQTLWDAFSGDLPSGHYKLSGNITANLNKNGVAFKNKICVDLNGNTITCATGRLYDMQSGSSVQICDSSANKTGKILTSGLPQGTTVVRGGMFYVGSGATLTLRSGTLAMDENANNYVTAWGGIIYTSADATFNMYDGVVENGKAITYGGNIAVGWTDTTGSTMNLYGGIIRGGISGDTGGNIQVFNHSVLKASGGDIVGGTAKNDTKGNCIRMSAGGKVVLSGDADIEEISIREESVDISGIYTGTVKLRLASGTITENFVIGASNNAKLGSANITVCHADGTEVTGLELRVAGSQLLMLAPKANSDCPGCGAKNVQWKPISEVTTNVLMAGYHYYVDQPEVVIDTQFEIQIGRVCVDLHGNTLSANIASRAFYVKEGTLHIMDSVGGGKARGVGGGTGAGWGGGTLYLEADGVAYLHSGTLTQKMVDGKEVALGGVVRNKGTFYMLGGEITGGKVCYSSDDNSKDGRGGNIYSSSGNVYLQGGTISNGDASGCRIGYGGNICIAGGNLYVGAVTITGGNAAGSTAGNGGSIYVSAGNVYLQEGCNIGNGTSSASHRGPCVAINSSAKLYLSGNANVAKICFFADCTDTFIVSGTYTGTTELWLRYIASSSTPAAGTVIGVSNNASFDASQFTLCKGTTWNDRLVSGLYVQAAGGKLMLVDTLKQAQVADGEGNTTAYVSVSDAIAAANTNNKPLVLLSDIAENVTVSQDMTIDLNGFALSGNVTLENGAKLVCKDTQTDDYVAAEGQYGKIPASWGAEAAEGYLKYSHNDGMVSFHKVDTKVESLNLRAEKSGMYYGATFKGDQIVASQVKRFGVALSIVEEPYAADGGDFQSHCGFSKFTGAQFEAGNTDEYTSTILVDILSDKYGTLTNRKHGQMDIYGVSYIQLVDGTYIYGNRTQKDLQWAMEWVNEHWNSIDENKKKAVYELCEKFPLVLKKWDCGTILESYEAYKKDAENSELKVLLLGNSHGLDTTNLLMDVFETEGTGQYKSVTIGAMYRSGCRMDQHHSSAEKGTADYAYYKNVSGDGKQTWDKTATYTYTLLQALQDEQWDIVVLQEMNTTAGMAANFEDNDIAYVINYVCKTLGYQPELKWHLVWANPEIPSEQGNGYSYYQYDEATRLQYIEAKSGNSSGDADGSENEGAVIDPTEEKPWIFEYGIPSSETINGVTYPASLKWEYNYNTMYNNDRNYMYSQMVANVKNYVLGGGYGISQEDVIASGTAVQYAINTLRMTEQKLYRDYTHMNDYGRVMTAYLWYAELMGLDSIDAVNYTVVPNDMRHEKFRVGNLELTLEDQQAIVAAVNYTLGNTFGDEQ